MQKDYKFKKLTHWHDLNSKKKKEKKNHSKNGKWKPEEQLKVIKRSSMIFPNIWGNWLSY